MYAAFSPNQNFEWYATKPRSETKLFRTWQKEQPKVQQRRESSSPHNQAVSPNLHQWTSQDVEKKIPYNAEKLVFIRNFEFSNFLFLEFCSSDEKY